MNSQKNTGRTRVIPLLPYLLAIITLVFLLLFCLNRIIAFSISQFTDFKVIFDKSRGNIFVGAEIIGLHVKGSKNKLGISAEKAFFTLRGRESLQKRRIVLDCDLQGVRFAQKGAEQKDETCDLAAESILAIPFSPEQKYENIIFTARLGKSIIEILGFKADSQDIRMAGKYVYIKDKENTLLDLKISFSPRISANFPDDVKSGALSPDEDGWYSTVISYKGNVIMLKALYSLTAVE